MQNRLQSPEKSINQTFIFICGVSKVKLNKKKCETGMDILEFSITLEGMENLSFDEEPLPSNIGKSIVTVKFVNGCSRCPAERFCEGALFSFFRSGDITKWSLRLKEIDGHLDEIGRLPMIHGVPFDRLIISQVMAENLIIITKDETIPLYNVKVLW